VEPEIEVDEKTRNFSANIWLYLGNGTRETQINQSIILFTKNKATKER